MSKRWSFSLLPFIFWSWSHVCFAGHVAAEQNVINPSLSWNCTESNMEANSISDGNVEILPYEPASNNILPKIPNLNASTWELYFFDAVSLDSAAVTLSFFRDAGRLKTQILAIWPDGETFVAEVFAKKSSVKSCEVEGVRAVWQGEDERTSFELSQDMKEVTIKLELPTTHGSISMSSEILDQNIDLEKKEEGETLHVLAPTVYWLQPIPRASVQVDLNINGRDLIFTGLGGLDRFWTPYSWMTLMDESVYLRAHAGSYTLLMLRLLSRVDRGIPHASVYLFHNAECIFATQNERVSLHEDYYSFKKTFHGELRGSFQDGNTGTVVDLVSQKDRKHWRFEMEHSSSWWNLPTGPSGTGNSGFIDKVSGGEVGGEVFEGKGTTGHCQLPALPRKV